MLFQLARLRRRPAFVLILVCCLLIVTLQSFARKTESEGFQAALQTANQDVIDGESPEKQIREAEVRHRAYQQWLQKKSEVGENLSHKGIISQDINDISVIQANANIFMPQNLFDLNGRNVVFTPSGAGYTIKNGQGGFDANLGTKLDFSQGTGFGFGFVSQNLDFSFPFYGTSFTNVTVSRYGTLVFRPSGLTDAIFEAGASALESFRELQDGLPRIAPYWNLLLPNSPSQGTNGIYFRREVDRVVVTWNEISDFDDPSLRTVSFQATLFIDGRIVFAYRNAGFSNSVLTGISPGSTTATPTIVRFSDPPETPISSPIVEVFALNATVDLFEVAKAFYTSHPNRDVYDFLYLFSEFPYSGGSDGFRFYFPIANDTSGIGLPLHRLSMLDEIGSEKLQGILNLNFITTFPDSPVKRSIGVNHGLSLLAHEQGHRWLAFLSYPGDPTLLLGRLQVHWSFFFNMESTISSPEARRSSVAEGSVYRDNGDGTFTTVNLIDGYSALDQYLMGLRPAAEVLDSFVLTNTSGENGPSDPPSPNVTVTGVPRPVRIGQILQANGVRVPDSTHAQKSFRAAVILLTSQGTQPSQSNLDKIARYRLAFESYFHQSTDYRASITTGLADPKVSNIIIAASAASFKSTLAPGEIAALFGTGMTNGATESATSQTLPTNLAGTEVRINGVPAPLFFASPSQINFQTPRSTSSTEPSLSAPSSTALIEIFVNGQLTRAGAFQVAPTSPSIFTTTQNGVGPASAVDAFTGAPAPFRAIQLNGKPNIIAVFGSGLGADFTDVTGDASAFVRATIDGAPVAVSYAGQAPGFSGLNQFNIEFPPNLAPGDHTLAIARDGISSRSVTISVR
jgi:uncharacterized protein (TIGR03437 family)